MSLLSWAEKRYAKGIAKAMKRSYSACKRNMPEASETRILKKALSMRTSREAKKLLSDSSFWRDQNNINLESVTLSLVIKEYRKGHLKNNFLPISPDTLSNLANTVDEIINNG